MGEQIDRQNIEHKCLRRKKGKRPKVKAAVRKYVEATKSRSKTYTERLRCLLNRSFQSVTTRACTGSLSFVQMNSFPCRVIKLINQIMPLILLLKTYELTTE